MLSAKTIVISRDLKMLFKQHKWMTVFRGGFVGPVLGDFPVMDSVSKSKHLKLVCFECSICRVLIQETRMAVI